MDEGPRPAGRFRRWARRLLWTLVLLELAWVAAGNAFLRTAWGPSVLGRRPEKLQVAWQDAWTPLPGLVRVHGLSLRGRSPKLTWSASTEAAWLWLAPLDLVRRRFHARWLDAEGFETRVHLVRRDPAGQPEIDGFEGLPEPAPRSSKHRWRVDLDRVSVRGVHELWFGPLHYRAQAGGGTASGRLLSQVRGPLSVPAADIVLAPGRVTVGDDLIGDVIRVAFVGRLDPFVPQEVRGVATLAHVSGRLDAETSGGSLGLVDYFLRGAPASVHGSGRLDTTLHLERGVLQPRSVLELADGRVRISYLGWQGEGHGVLGGKVGEGGETTLEVTLDEAELGLRQVGDKLLVSRGVRLVATADRVDLSEARPELTLIAEMPDAVIADLRTFQAFLPTHAQVELLGGSGTVSGRATLDTRPTAGVPSESGMAAAVTGALRMRGQGIDVRVRGKTFAADLLLDIEVPRGDLVARRLDLDGSRLQLERVKAPGGDRRTWWADLHVPDGSLRLPQDGSVTSSSVDARVEAALADSRPFLALVVERRRSIRWFERLLTFENLHMTGRLRTVADGVELRDVEVRDRGDDRGRNKNLRILGQVRFDEDGYDALMRASMKIAIKNVAAGVQVRDGQVEDIDLYHSLDWYQARSQTFWQPGQAD